MTGYRDQNPKNWGRRRQQRKQVRSLSQVGRSQKVRRTKALAAGETSKQLSAEKLKRLSTESVDYARALVKTHTPSKASAGNRFLLEDARRKLRRAVELESLVYKYL